MCDINSCRLIFVGTAVISLALSSGREASDRFVLGLVSGPAARYSTRMCVNVKISVCYAGYTPSIESDKRDAGLIQSPVRPYTPHKIR